MTKIADGCIAPDPPALAGHFPGNAIVPGVLLLGEVLSAIERRFGHPADAFSWPVVKFMAPMRPNELFAGLHGATKALALELASRGITVNAVASGHITTAATQDLFDQDSINRLVPMKRGGTPADVAGLVAYRVSDAAAYLSGQIISVNGAMA